MPVVETAVILVVSLVLVVLAPLAIRRDDRDRRG